MEVLIVYTTRMKKILLPLAGLIMGLLILGGLWYYYNFRTYAPVVYVTRDETGATTTLNTANGTSTVGAPVYSMAEVSTHTTTSSCYTVISGKVYDLTMWVNLHPGGKQAILSLCGVDGTQRFMQSHGGAQKQMDILSRYYIGNLSN